MSAANLPDPGPTPAQPSALDALKTLFSSVYDKKHGIATLTLLAYSVFSMLGQSSADPAQVAKLTADLKAVASDLASAKAETNKIKGDIYVPAPKPPNVPKGETPKASPKSILNVSFVTDPKITADVAATLNDAGLSKFLDDSGVNDFHVLTTDDGDVAAAARAIAPAIVIQDASGVILAQTPLISADQAKRFIGTYLGK